MTILARSLRSPRAAVLGARAFSASSAASTSALLLISHKSGEIVPATLNAVTAARALGGKVTGVVVGDDSARGVAEKARSLGLDSVLLRTSASLKHVLAEPLAPVLASLAKAGSFTHLVAPHDAVGKNVFPRVAAILDVQQISDVMGIKDEATFVRPVYAGNAIETVKSSDSIKVFTVRSASWDAAQAGEASTEIDAAEAQDVGPVLAEWVSEALVASERPDLGAAASVVSGGRGLKSKDSFDSVIVPLADALGAAIGASRAAVDSGYAENSLQVGQTGKVVAPSLYVAVGISGAIQHLAGMKDSKCIVAVNKDPDAPIFQVADVGLVADLFEAVPQLTEKIKAAKA